MKLTSFAWIHRAAVIRSMPPKRSGSALQFSATKRACATAIDTSGHSGDVPNLSVLEYTPALVPASLLKRYKRFLGDVQLDGDAADAAETTIHVPNTGPMTGLLDALPSSALLSVSANTKRKYAHTLEWLRPSEDVTTAWVGVHSAKANAMVRALLEARAVPELGSYTAIRAEVKYGKNDASRVDFVLDRNVEEEGTRNSSSCYVEVKSVTLAEDMASDGRRIALFPDTVSTRAQRHVQELTSLVGKGGEAAMVFLVQRGDCVAFAPSWQKDPEYAALVEAAAEAGVQVVALAVELHSDKTRVVFKGPLPVQIGYGKPNE